MQPIIAGLLAGIPTVDSDGMGRAFPELQMSSYLFDTDVSVTPLALSDTGENAVVVTRAVSAQWAERIGRQVAVSFRLPTYWCSANFAYLMASDIRLEVEQLDWVSRVRVKLEDHMFEDEVNTGVNEGLSFRDTFAVDNAPRNIEDYLRSALTLEKTRAEFEDPDNTFLLAWRGVRNAPVGFAKLCTTTDDPSVQEERSIEIERIYADKHEIGQGVGAALMRACLETAGELECRVIWLGVWEQNDRAIGFYERWGFTTVGARDFMLGSERQNDLVMARAITG